jgi:hypothetical protein
MGRGEIVATYDFRLATKSFNTPAKSLLCVLVDELDPARFAELAAVSSSEDELVEICLTRRRQTADSGMISQF